jgi:hypothetical protein
MDKLSALENKMSSYSAGSGTYVFNLSLLCTGDKTDRHDIPEILLKVAISTIKQTN